MRKLRKVVFRDNFCAPTLMIIEERFAALRLRLKRLKEERWQLSLCWDKCGSQVQLYHGLADTIVRKWFLESFGLTLEKVDTVIGDETAVEVGIRRIGLGVELQENGKARDLVIFLVAPTFQYKVLPLDKLSIDLPKSVKDWNFWWSNFKAGETQTREQVRERLKSLSFRPAIVDNFHPPMRALKT